MALEARIACPFCGGLIHPVAGRCKHCKGDLAAAREQRPPARAPLPPLAGGTGSPAATAALAATYITPVPSPIGQDGSAPVLPPRPTGSRSAAEPPASPLHNWPVVVIGLAAIAIVAAVAIMMWPASKPSHAAAHGAQPPPAPERMDTDSLPRADPWDHAHGQVDPPPPHVAPPANVDPLPAPVPSLKAPKDSATDDDDDNDDLPKLRTFAPPHDSGADLVLAITVHACARLTACGVTDEASRNMCDAIGTLSRGMKVPQCSAAKQCLDEVDRIDCSADATPAKLMSTIPSCFAAATSC